MSPKRKPALFRIAVVASIALHVALVATAFAIQDDVEEAPLTARDISFFIQQILPAGDGAAEPATSAGLPAPPPAPAPALPADPGEDEIERLLRRADEVLARGSARPEPQTPLPGDPTGSPEPGKPGPEIFRYVHDVVRPRVYQHLRWPDPLPPPGRRGVAVVQIEIARSGALLGVLFLERSPVEALNEAARRAVLDAAPFPSLEDDVDLDSFRVNCRFDFRQDP